MTKPDFGAIPADGRVTATDAERLLGIPRDWIYQWKNRDGTLAAVGMLQGPNGASPLYRATDLLILAEARRRGRRITDLRKLKIEIDDSNNVVYFARTAGLVKIGTTNQLWRRLGQLGHPELLGVIPGGYDAERTHHRMFADEHVQGEIFVASPRILAYVDEHCTLPDRPGRTPAGAIPSWKRDE
jgi:hypothetical protein